MSTGPSNQIRQDEGVLHQASTHVYEANIDVTGKCRELTNHVEQLTAGWAGQGSSAFSNLMAAWQQRQRTILDALERLSGALEETDRRGTSNDQQQASSIKNTKGGSGEANSLDLNRLEARA